MFKGVGCISNLSCVACSLAAAWKKQKTQPKDAAASSAAALPPPAAPKDEKNKLLQVGDRVKLLGVSPQTAVAAEAVVKVVGTGSLLMEGYDFKVGDLPFAL